MAKFKDLFNTWKNMREIDLRPYRESALRQVRLAIVGRPGSGRHTLAEQMRGDPQRPESRTLSPLLIADLDAPDEANAAELIILVLDATATGFSQERALARKWAETGKKVLAFVNKIDLIQGQRLASSSAGWAMERVLHGSALDAQFLQYKFIPVILEMLPERHLALGRQFPLFRVAIAQQLINEACFSNAVYSFSTGLAEVVPFLDVPLNITDTVVLTKAQAFLVYKVGLALGFSTRWQDYLAEFGSVIGSGFIWRQLARMLIGLIPVWGIVPKVAVAYAGTYVVGHAILQWYLTGKKITRQQMRALYAQALANGKKVAKNMVSLLPHRRGGKRKAALPAPLNLKACSFCQRPNAADANFCQYCGQPFGVVGSEPS